MAERNQGMNDIAADCEVNNNFRLEETGAESALPCFRKPVHDGR